MGSHCLYAGLEGLLNRPEASFDGLNLQAKEATCRRNHNDHVRYAVRAKGYSSAMNEYNSTVGPPMQKVRVF